MEKAELFRRAFHATAMVYLIYYILPDELFPGFYKWYGVLLILACALVIEAVRLKMGKTPFGMRKYEAKQVSAFAWFAVGMTIALLLFKMQYVVPVVIGMALIDPLIGEVKKRKRKLYPLLPCLLYGTIMFICLFLLTDMTVLLLIVLTAVGTFFAIFAESWDIKKIDDDFLMVVVPLFALALLDYALTVTNVI